MHKLLPLLLLAACGDDGGSGTVDARPIDSPGAVDMATIDAPALALTCASYCTGILARCSGTNAQFANMQNCLDSCAALPMGTLGQTSGNTLGCRVYHTEAAAAGPNQHCVHAGPGGGGECGATICEGFCSIAVSECPAQWSGNTCAAECAIVPSSGTPFNTSASGDSIECRLYHLTMASTAPGTHCGHTDGVGACP